MKNWIKTIIKRLRCKHEWKFVETVEKQEQIFDYECYIMRPYTVETWICKKCGKKRKVDSRDYNI